MFRRVVRDMRTVRSCGGFVGKTAASSYHQVSERTGTRGRDRGPVGGGGDRGVVHNGGGAGHVEGMWGKQLVFLPPGQ